MTRYNWIVRVLLCSLGIVAVDELPLYGREGAVARDRWQHQWRNVDVGVAGVSQSAPLCSRDTSPPEQEWSSLRPAAKATTQASNCPSVDVAAFTGNALLNYLRTTSKGCLERTLHISNNPAIKADVPTIFSNRNMQSVFAEIERLAATYDGTNSTGMLQLWFFVQVGYDYYRFFPGETGGDRSMQRLTAPISPRRTPLRPATTFMPPTTRLLRYCITTLRPLSLLD